MLVLVQLLHYLLAHHGLHVAKKKKIFEWRDSELPVHYLARSGTSSDPDKEGPLHATVVRLVGAFRR